MNQMGEWQQKKWKVNNPTNVQKKNKRSEKKFKCLFILNDPATKNKKKNFRGNSNLAWPFDYQSTLIINNNNNNDEKKPLVKKIPWYSF